MYELSTIVNYLDSVRNGCTDEYGNPNGGEFWYARDIMELLGYKKWQDFNNCIQRAISMCSMSGIPENQHFTDITRSRNIRSTTPTGGEFYKTYVSEDYKLSRYACYLIAINGNTQECSLAQAYFLTKARQMEMMEQNYEYLNQLDTREMCALTDKRFSGAMKSHGVSGAGIGRIKSKGDYAYFGGNNTQDMKEKLECPKNVSLYNVLDPTVALGRALAASFTTKDINNRYLDGEDEITPYHIDNNEYVRNVLINKGIIPEEMPAIQDSRKTQRYINRSEEDLAENSSMLTSPIIFINR